MLVSAAQGNRQEVHSGRFVPFYYAIDLLFNHSFFLLFFSFLLAHSHSRSLTFSCSYLPSFFVVLLQDVPIDFEKAKKEADELYQAGEKRWGTDERFVITFFLFNLILPGCNKQRKRCHDHGVSNTG